MPGIPQVREAGRLYGDDPDVLAALVRLLQHPDGGPWVVLLNSPAEKQASRRWERADETAARQVLDAIYAEGETKGGRWEIHRPDPY